ncbi:MAG: pyridoxal-phosphate dependent enzyme [Candidatus Marinimicrobia bacterium]|nr:pyridoxal-phosphate dependent enzyme [Candidatus Neomarinimicrobiota bacterium]
MIYYPTPFDPLNHISKFISINVFAKRDDLYPVVGGGNKARKLNYILNEEVRRDHNAIVTAGSGQSNHIRSTALYAAALGWKLICIVHDNKPERYEGNLKIAKITGAELRFVQKDDVKEAMDKAMADLSSEGYKPYYIWGGGHCVRGSLAYYEAVKELKDQLKDLRPDYLFVASGTGTTQAGIEIGTRHLLPGCKVIGISVAREAKRGKEAVLDSMNELNTYLGNPVKMPEDIVFDDNWVGNGYEATYPELSDTIEWAAGTEGLILDPTYTGKAFHALKTYAREGRLESHSNVIFWHTGGLLNLMASREI